MGVIPAGYFLPDPSALPPGGCPAWDRDYEAWLREFVAVRETTYLDRYWPGVPDRIPFRIYQITNHLFKWAVGRAFPSGEGPNYLHKLRYVSVQFHYRRDELVAEAGRYVAGLIDDAMTKQLEPAGHR